MIFFRSLICGLLLAAVPAFCSFTTYNNRGLWQTDVSSFATIDFESFSLSPTFGPDGVKFDNPGYSFSDCAGSLSTNQACFVNTTGLGYAIPTSVAGDPVPVGHKFFRMVDSSGSLKVKLPSGIIAGGLDLYTVSLNNKPLTILLTDASNVTTTYSNVSPGFFGFTSTNSIAMIQLSSSGQSEIWLDRIDFSDTLSGGTSNPGADTPESGSMAYMGLGAIALWFGSRKQLPSIRRSALRQS